MSTRGAIALAFESLRSLAAGSIGASYTAVGDPFANIARKVIIANYTDAQLFFSLDGTNDHIVLAANKEHEFFYESKDDSYFQKSTTVSVKESGTPTTGAVYVMVMFGGKQ